jgi:hypothetical protein
MTVLTLTSASEAIASSHAELIFAEATLSARLKITDPSAHAPLATLETRTLNAQMVNNFSSSHLNSFIIVHSNFRTKDTSASTTRVRCRR